jgi:hypothetical protein
LIGAGVRLFERPLANAFSFFSFSNSADVDVYGYREQDIFLMTDEESQHRHGDVALRAEYRAFLSHRGVALFPHALTTANL